jgi:hypothetical protein
VISLASSQGKGEGKRHTYYPVPVKRRSEQSRSEQRSWLEDKSRWSFYILPSPRQKVFPSYREHDQRLGKVTRHGVYLVPEEICVTITKMMHEQ